MLIIKDEQERVLTRRHALGIKRIVLEDGVVRGDFIEEEVCGNELHIKKSQVEPEHETYTFLCNEFGVYGQKDDVKSLIKVTLCDDVMMLTLLAGSIVIRPTGVEMVATLGIDESKLPQCITNEVKWFSLNDILSFVVFYGKYAKKHPYDYEFTLEVSGGYVQKVSSCKIKPFCEARDISLGAFAALDILEEKNAPAVQSPIVREQRIIVHSDSFEFDDDDDLSVGDDSHDEPDDDEAY